jgi:arsenite methyltransferase
MLAGAARQLGKPQGWRGRLIGRGLNRGNRSFIGGAVSAADLHPGDAAADIGFGGGIGLRLLLDQVGPSGRVHGVDFSSTMVAQARSTFSAECDSGTLSIHEGSMLDLPLANDSVDAVITVNTVYFLDDVGQAVAEIVRVLRPGGRLIVALGDPDMMAKMPVTAHGFRLRPPEEILAAMAAYGLVDTRTERVSEAPDAGHLLIGSAHG